MGIYKQKYKGERYSNCIYPMKNYNKTFSIEYTIKARCGI